MVEKKGLGRALSHAVLLFGAAIVLFPLYVALVATSHSYDVLIGTTPLWFGEELIKNFTTVLTEGLKAAGGIPVWVMMGNSLIMALGIALGKIAISITAAYAIVYFRFPGRELCFVLIFITLMMPVEVRIVPTFQVAATLNFIDSYAGLILPLIASATATFLYRQMFMTIPQELLEAARIDGAGPWRFFVDVVLPLSRTNTAALFVVLFIYGWNQYLWPLLVTNQEGMYTVVMGIQRMVNIPDAVPEWNLIMAVALLGMLPPLLVVLGMQKLFVRGLVETEK
ncbi:sn-glycerol-3-phosphate ABC transporter permease UgpE [Mailhella massiliensis]|uniref:sn-glycerol-3-phosphate transport system permease protein UgpE n=1 Tax=Mailhella massiliensis TaxID=1903261 RepID=A0A921DSA4_9BACT|nr:sn-glycerol-3-phosphate ABC transporter permease UgpE [Mailhella massiliensis]HJD97926.1 sn-glycerol-3-phosphate ABC transporter permease UgpE [Mailhella massiliensis]